MNDRLNNTMLSFVIPCYNSRNTIGGVIDEIEVSVARSAYADSFEIVAVVDGSPDDVADVLRKLSHEKKHLKVVELSRNFGQSNALMAGYHYAIGDIVITLDDDGQCPVDQFEDLIAPILSEADMSVARYPSKKQSLFKNFGSRVNGAMARWLMGFPKEFEMSNFYAFTKLVRNSMIKYKNPYPYLSGLAFQSTKRVVNVPMHERERVSGKSNYTFKKLISLWLNGFTSFSVKPLRVADFIGMLCAVAGFLFGVYTVVCKMVNPDIAVGYSSIIASLFVIGGIIMILLGVIGEYVGRIFICINDTPQFIVREATDHMNESIEDSTYEVISGE